eukprot:4941960-Amphidinium_carterae.1
MAQPRMKRQRFPLREIVPKNGGRQGNTWWNYHGAVPSPKVILGDIYSVIQREGVFCIMEIDSRIGNAGRGASLREEGAVINACLASRV